MGSSGVNKNLCKHPLGTHHTREIFYHILGKENIKFEYEHEKARREVYEQEIEELEKMEALDYLSFLNDETKEKLIVLCLSRKLLEDFNEDGETNYEEDKMEDEIDEEMEISEDSD